MSVTKECPTRLLSDAPTKEDAFGHTRIAESIAELIKGEEGGKCIGLVGSWGSGKSSVIEILKERLREAGGENIGVFVFDAWAHQGDPLRRAFLEQLMSYLLEDRGWLSEARKWVEKKMDELSKRFQSTEVTKESVLTPVGTIFALLLLLLPLGFQLSVKFISEPCYRGTEIFGIVLSLLPFLLITGVWVYWRPTVKFWRKQFWVENRKSPDKRSLSAFIVKNSREEEYSNTIRTPTPRR